MTQSQRIKKTKRRPKPFEIRYGDQTLGEKFYSTLRGAESISPFWSGRLKAKHLSLFKGLKEKLEPWDIVLNKLYLIPFERPMRDLHNQRLRVLGLLFISEELSISVVKEE